MLTGGVRVVAGDKARSEKVSEIDERKSKSKTLSGLISKFSLMYRLDGAKRAIRMRCY